MLELEAIVAATLESWAGAGETGQATTTANTETQRRIMWLRAAVVCKTGHDQR
jgi:hypothetical protein